MQATQATLLVSDGQLQSFSLDARDIDRASYQTLKQKFIHFRAANPSIRFAYILGYRPDIEKQFFYLDSESTNSSDYSPPGQIYKDTRPYDIEQYKKGISYVDGPYHDSWGEWVSGYAPVLDEYGQMIGLVGVDVSTSAWRTQSTFAVTVILIIALLLYVIIALLITKLHRARRSVEMLTDSNASYASKNHALESIKKNLVAGNITAFLPSETIKLDDSLLQSLDISETAHTNFEIFLSVVHPDDKELGVDFFAHIRAGDTPIKCALRLRVRGGEYHLYKIKGETVSEMGTNVRFSGVMHDTTL